MRGERREGRVGVWVRRPDKGPGVEDKIAAVGIRVRRWVTFHGISLNVEPDLSHYSGIVPCGISGHGVTSLVDLGIPVTMPEVDDVMRTDLRGGVRRDGEGGVMRAADPSCVLRGLACSRMRGTSG